MPANPDFFESAALRAYERGRVVVGARRAAIATGLVAGASFVTTDSIAWAWLPLTAVVVLFGEWRGQWSTTAMRRGLALGLATALLPMTILRPCCSFEARAMGIACCTTPSVCWAAGAVVGALVAFAIPRAPKGRRAEAVLAAAAGTISAAVVRCSSLVVGEAIGLLAGIVIATVVFGAVRVTFSPHARHAR